MSFESEKVLYAVLDDIDAGCAVQAESESVRAARDDRRAVMRIDHW